MNIITSFIYMVTTILISSIFWFPKMAFAENITFREEIKVNFDIGNFKLFKGYKTFILPIDAVTNVYATQDGIIKKRIDTITDLTSITNNIENGDQALEFIKLFKHHKTNFFFNKLKSKKREFLLNILPPDIKIDHCAITQSKFDELNLKPISVLEQDNMFIIELNVVKNKNRTTVAIFRNTEMVSKKGEYQLISQRLITELPATEVIIPILY